MVTAAKFPPLGERGAAGTLPHFQFHSFPAAQADPALNDATMVILMMETLEALEHVEEIAAVDGVDMMMVGTSDLTAEMGIPGKHDDPRCGTLARTIAAVRARRGTWTREPRRSHRRRWRALRPTGTDLGFLSACQQKAKQVRVENLTGDWVTGTGGSRPAKPAFRARGSEVVVAARMMNFAGSKGREDNDRQGGTSHGKTCAENRPGEGQSRRSHHGGRGYRGVRRHDVRADAPAEDHS